MQSYDIAGLAPYQLVIVTITATNGGGTSGNSNEVTGRAAEAGKLLYCTRYIWLNVYFGFIVAYGNSYCKQ